MPVRVQAVGQSVDLDPLDGLNGIESKGGVVLAGPNMQTSAEGVFAGGGMIPSERTVTVAIGHPPWLLRTERCPALSYYMVMDIAIFYWKEKQDACR
tara:strand:+ start:3061 stop:3351 length:291 start_codon:yes stop_codon:yes gene_type:complete